MIPSKIIIAWTGTTPPLTWSLCDGTNGTPDLRNKFILSAGISNTLGQVGGASSATMTMNNMPKHDHNYSAARMGILQKYMTSLSITKNSLKIWLLTTPTETNSTGISAPIDVTPPYYVLAYIMKN